MSLASRICIAAVIIGAMIWGAVAMDRRWRASHPEEKPFRWGYFQALLFFPGGLSWFATPFLWSRLEWHHWMMIIVYGIGGSYAGYTLLKEKNTWAWMFIVLAQFNLLNWIINFYYGSNRWKEFR